MILFSANYGCNGYSEVIGKLFLSRRIFPPAFCCCYVAATASTKTMWNFLTCLISYVTFPRTFSNTIFKANVIVNS